MAKKKTTRTVRKAAKKASKRHATKSAAAAEAIRQLDAKIMTGANARNAGAVVKAFYAPGAVLMPPNHPLVEGPTAIQGFLQGLIDSGFTSIKLETTNIASAGDLAYGRGRYMLSLSPPGGAPVQDSGKYVVVYRRQPSGAWRAVADIFNSDQAAQ